MGQTYPCPSNFFLITGILDYGKYNFRYLINGMIEHNIYQQEQIACLNKMLA